jgi:hypothetical protein
MNRNNWGRINELFEAARRLPVEERQAWVRGATADEPTRADGRCVYFTLTTW